MKINNLILLIIILVSTSVFGQQGRQRGMEEEIKSKKIAFITEKLELTPAEAERFWPVYNILETERYEIHRKRRGYSKKYRSDGESISDSEFLKIADNIVALQMAEAKLAEQYNKKFQDILSPGKVVKLYLVEGWFRAHLMKEYSQRKHSGQGKGKGE
jgi:hypothetical protein